MRTQLNPLLWAWMVILALGWMGCGSEGASGNEEAGEETATEETETTTSNYLLTPFTESVQFPGAKIAGVTFEDGKFNFSIEGDSYKLGLQTPDAPQKMCANSGQGQHIHLIVDDQPYAAKYVAEFDYEIPDGEHYVLSFLSRSYHESIKTADAHSAMKTQVAGNSFERTEPIEEPMLFYSRPKGTYVGKADTEKVMLDFYLVNADLGEDYKVKVNINGEKEFIVDKWQPYYIEGLPMGDNKIRLTLIDAEGKKVDTPLNPVERVFTLKADPAEEG